MSEEIKTGAYICKGCGLGERLDCGQLATIAEREGKANLVREHEFLCNAEGVAMIQNDIDNEGVNKVMIAACSRRSKSEAFSFENVAISRSNLREGVIWVRPDTDEAKETTQEMAADYVRMGCAEIRSRLLKRAANWVVVQRLTTSAYRNTCPTPSWKTMAWPRWSRRSRLTARLPFT